MKPKRAGRPNGSIRWTISRGAREFGSTDRTLSKRLTLLGALPGKDGLYSTRDIFEALAGDREMRQVMLEIRREELADLRSKMKKRESTIRSETLAAVFRVLKPFFDDIGRIVRDSGLGPERNQRVQALMVNAWLAANGCKAQLDVEQYAAANYLGRDSEADRLLQQTYEKAENEHQKIEASKPVN